MNSHIIVSVLLCTLSCEPAEIRVWDGDSIRLGLTSEAEAVRIFNIDAPEIAGQCAYESDLAQRSKRRLAEFLRVSGWRSFAKAQIAMAARLRSPSTA